MANSFFQFKQFTIHQDKCAMKVCSDACLFGAVVAKQLLIKPFSQVLDIGAGTGLLSLMLAQKLNTTIDAVEIDPAAFEQAAANAEASIFNKKITVFNSDINSFNPAKKYDAIISNPPFFEGDLKSSHNNKNAAKHDTSLTLQQLLDAVMTHLVQGGIFTVLLPFHRIDHCVEMAAEKGLFITKKILVKQTPDHQFFRGILFFSDQPSAPTSQEIIIKDEGKYTPAFTGLLKDYYLYL